jgi:hypothetical protein
MGIVAWPSDIDLGRPRYRPGSPNMPRGQSNLDVCNLRYLLRRNSARALECTRVHFLLNTHTC